MVAWKIHVPDALDARVRRRMNESGESLSHVVRAAVDAYLLDVPPVMTGLVSQARSFTSGLDA